MSIYIQYYNITGTDHYCWTLTDPQGGIILNKCYNTGPVHLYLLFSYLYFPPLHILLFCTSIFHTCIFQYLQFQRPRDDNQTSAQTRAMLWNGSICSIWRVVTYHRDVHTLSADDLTLHHVSNRTISINDDDDDIDCIDIQQLTQSTRHVVSNVNHPFSFVCSWRPFRNKFYFDLPLRQFVIASARPIAFLYETNAIWYMISGLHGTIWYLAMEKYSANGG